MNPPALLILSADPQVAVRLQSELDRQYSIVSCGSIGEARLIARQQVWSALVADFRDVVQGGHNEDRFLEEIQERCPDVVLNVLANRPTPEPLERRLACSGAAVFFEPVDLEGLMSGLRRPELPAVSSAQGVSIPGTSSAVGTPVASNSDYVMQGISRRFETNTPKLRMMLSDLEVAARHDITVLLIGETGAGKTYLSRLVHEISPRRNEPFLPVACGALPADLIESELFGHVKGAFTSAHADKEGKFLAARRGTILLDEIDVLGPEQQVKLLRVIESGEFEAVGSNRTQRSEARLIVASNLDLQPLVEQGRFRPDLYYRLNMLKFEIPPLRQRKPDIIPLAHKFVAEHSVKHKVRIDRIDDSLIQALLSYPWPGNVRELEHVIQRAVIYCRDHVLMAQHLPSHILLGQAGPGNDGQLLPPEASYPMQGNPTLQRQVALSEREIIEQALFANNFSRTNTAKALGISRVTLYNKMKKYGINH